MKHRNILFIIPFSFFLLLVGCEKQIDIDIEDLESQVVVQSQGEAGVPLAVSLTYSRPTFGSFYVYYGEDYFQSVTDATVTLSVNGGASETATRDGGTYTFTHMPQPGEELELAISVPGKDEVKASATVPLPAQVGDITVSTVTELPDIDGNADVNISVFVPLTDRASSDDYYSIMMTRYDTTIYTYYDEADAVSFYDTVIYERDWFECQDQLLVNDMDPVDAIEGMSIPTFYGSEMLFTDAYINGTTHSIELRTYADIYYYNNEGRWRDDGNGYYMEYPYRFTYVIHSTFKIEVITLTRDLYLYRQTMDNYSDDELLGYFSEPVPIHSNINGGIGIFGLSSKKTYSVTLDIQQ